MRKFLIYILLGLLVMIVVTFIMGLGDDAYTRTYYKGVWYKDIVSSLKYYVLWVLPYWWLMILIGTVILGAVFYGIKLGIGKLTG